MLFRPNQVHLVTLSIVMFVTILFKWVVWYIALYFNKIQCFCFEEQRLEPGEEIDMPVFFFIDPEFLDDPALANCNSIMLSYTFFKTGEEEMPSITDSRDICPLPASKKEVA